jgi:hypothetical protein
VKEDHTVGNLLRMQLLRDPRGTSTLRSFLFLLFAILDHGSVLKPDHFDVLASCFNSSSVCRLHVATSVDSSRKA